MTGIIAGNFDIIHPGYIHMFNEMKKYVDEIHVLLHIDPSLNRPEKIKPILSVKDRTMTLLSIKGITNVYPYNSEEQLFKLISDLNPKIRFLGEDYCNRSDYTGYGLPPKIIFLKRDHGWSTTKFKNLIAKLSYKKNKMKIKTILVTGGAGFIGSHLCERLLKDKNKVICLDNLFTGNLSNINSLISNNNFEFVNHDITKPYYRDKIDEIYNLACPASPIHYQSNPIKTVKTCTIGVINMLGLAKNNNSKILQASTSEVYGDPEIHPQKEDYNGNVNTIGFRSCYDEGKRCAETLFMDYKREHSLNIKIVRIFNTYGPNMTKNDGRVVSNFILQALNNENITIYGDGLQTRSFQFIDDLVEGLIKMMNSDFTGPVNLGNPIELSMNSLATKVIKLTNSESHITYKELPQNDPKRRRPNINLAMSILDWKPIIDLETGLKNTINYFKNI